MPSFESFIPSSYEVGGLGIPLWVDWNLLMNYKDEAPSDLRVFGALKLSSLNGCKGYV